MAKKRKTSVASCGCVLRRRATSASQRMKFGPGAFFEIVSPCNKRILYGKAVHGTPGYCVTRRSKKQSDIYFSWGAPPDPLTQALAAKFDGFVQRSA